jgi:hypothetical protein
MPITVRRLQKEIGINRSSLYYAANGKFVSETEAGISFVFNNSVSLFPKKRIPFLAGLSSQGPTFPPSWGKPLVQRRVRRPVHRR